MKWAMKELRKDFKECLSEINFKDYDPFSRKFMKAGFIGQMWMLVKMLHDDDDVEAIDADLEAIDEPAIEGSIEVEGSDDLSAILEGEDFQAALDETGLTKEEAV